MSAIRRTSFLIGVSLTLLGSLPGAAVAGEDGWSAAEIDAQRQLLDAAKESCALGLLGAGSPFTLTRVSDFFPRDTARPGDRLLAVNDKPIEDAGDLKAALGELRGGDAVSLSIARHDERIDLEVTCMDSSPTVEARQQALLAASEHRWDDCIKATVFEEIVWGGASSESARMRLWCYEAKTRARTVVTRLHAELVYEYALLKLEEMQNVPGGMLMLRRDLNGSIAALRAAGFIELARTISARLSSSVI